MELISSTEEKSLNDLSQQTEKMLNLKSQIHKPDGGITWEYLVRILNQLND